MTKVGRLIIEQEEAAVRNGIEKEDLRIAKNFLNEGVSAEKVARATGLDISVVQKIADEITDSYVTA